LDLGPLRSRALLPSENMSPKCVLKNPSSVGEAPNRAGSLFQTCGEMYAESDGLSAYKFLKGRAVRTGQFHDQVESSKQCVIEIVQSVRRSDEETQWRRVLKFLKERDNHPIQFRDISELAASPRDRVDLVEDQYRFVRGRPPKQAVHARDSLTKVRSHHCIEPDNVDWQPRSNPSAAALRLFPHPGGP
jgi:hypothetical protein